MPFIPAIVGAAVGGAEAGAAAAAVGGEVAAAASVGGEAAAVGGDAAAVGGDIASIGGDSGSIANNAVRGLSQLGKNLARTDDPKSLAKGLKDAYGVGSKLHHLQNDINQPGGTNNKSGPQGAPENNQIGHVEALEHLVKLEEKLDALQGLVARVARPESFPVAPHGPSTVFHLPETPGDGPAAPRDLHAGVEENPFPLEPGAGSGRLRI